MDLSSSLCLAMHIPKRRWNTDVDRHRNGPELTRPDQRVNERAGCRTAIEKRTNMRAGALQRFQGRYPHE